MITTLSPGMFLAIPIGPLGFGYARVLIREYLAFYDYHTQEVTKDLVEISQHDVLFILQVRATAKREWPCIGELPLESALNAPVVRFTQASEDYRECVIYDTSGKERAATPEECVGLEPGIVWEKEGAENRLLDGLLRRPNRVLERYKARLQP